MSKKEETFPKPTIPLNDLEISTELAAIQISDIKIPKGGKSIMERYMRCRILECQPGETIATHSHINRPAILYVLEGTGEEHSNQREGIRYWKEGDCFAEYNNTEHWVKNRSKRVPLRVLTFDLYDDGKTHKDNGGC